MDFRQCAVEGCERPHNAKGYCAMHYQRWFQTPENRRRVKLKMHYNLTPEQWDAQLEHQGLACAICGSDVPGGRFNQWATDHDHGCCPDKAKSCGRCLRGLLCNDCNHGLGKFKDDPEILSRAITYLTNGGVWEQIN